MENIYFELRNKEGYKYGMIENIPEDTTSEIVRERVEVDFEGESIIIVNQDLEKNIDIIFDWTSLDFEGGLDEDLVIVDEILEKAIQNGLEDKVVYTALSIMKRQPEKSISDAIIESYSKLTE